MSNSAADISDISVIHKLIVTRLAETYSKPITPTLLRAWADALSQTDDQMAHAVHQQFLRGEVQRHPDKVGWMPSPEEFMWAYKAEKKLRDHKEQMKHSLEFKQDLKTLPTEMPKKLKDLIHSFAEAKSFMIRKPLNSSEKELLEASSIPKNTSPETSSEKEEESLKSA